jgi:precorrin-3B synthase
VHPLAQRRCAVGVGLPFGAVRAERFAALVAAAGARGASSLQPCERHGALAIGFDPAGARAFQRDAARLGFALGEHEPVRRISTCAGQPGCASAHLATRPLAAALAERAAPLLDGSLRVHLAGCAKRCGAPQRAELQLTATEAGLDVALAAARGAHAVAALARELVEVRP